MYQVIQTVLLSIVSLGILTPTVTSMLQEDSPQKGQMKRYDDVKEYGGDWDRSVFICNGKSSERSNSHAVALVIPYNYSVELLHEPDLVFLNTLEYLLTQVVAGSFYGCGAESMFFSRGIEMVHSLALVDSSPRDKSSSNSLNNTSCATQTSGNIICLEVLGALTVVIQSEDDDSGGMTFDNVRSRVIDSLKAGIEGEESISLALSNYTDFVGISWGISSNPIPMISGEVDNNINNRAAVAPWFISLASFVVLWVMVTILLTWREARSKTSSFNENNNDLQMLENVVVTRSPSSSSSICSPIAIQQMEEAKGSIKFTTFFCDSGNSSISKNSNNGNNNDNLSSSTVNSIVSGDHHSSSSSSLSESLPSTQTPRMDVKQCNSFTCDACRTPESAIQFIFINHNNSTMNKGSI